MLELYEAHESGDKQMQDIDKGCVLSSVNTKLPFLAEAFTLKVLNALSKHVSGCASVKEACAILAFSDEELHKVVERAPQVLGRSVALLK